MKAASECFTFGIPLIARASARDWQLVERLLKLTLMSVGSQTDRDFCVVIAGHDRPSLSGEFAFEFVEADWVAEPIRADNLDSGRKKTLISRWVIEHGGGLLMFLDADDWVDRLLVATARSKIAPHQVGGIITEGYATDFRSLRTVAVPHIDLFDRQFHELCGSSIVARLNPAAGEDVRRNPFSVLHEHYRWIETCRELGLDWQRLDIRGNYLINTGANHSEEHGAFAQWRCVFAEEVACKGNEIDQVFLERFGLDRVSFT